MNIVTIALFVLWFSECLSIHIDTNYVHSGPIDYVYDYIIVGAGSAGSVLGNRLSENPHTKVLLVEAGGYENILTTVPVFSTLTQFLNLDWNFKSTPQQHGCFALDDKTAIWHQGKVLGGSSSINRMIYSRGTRYDYDKWETLGATGWNYHNILPYFIKAENYVSRPIDIDLGVHGFYGPLQVAKSKIVSFVSDAVLRGAHFLGLPIKDYNDGTGTGFQVSQLTNVDGIRQSSSRAYLEHLHRANLHVIVNSFVKKVVINHHKVATGVLLTRAGKTQFIIAKRDVILSAGVLQSPKILMLSGIGPKYELLKHWIPVIKDIPAVGKDLRDHVSTIVPIEMKKSAFISPIELAKPPSIIKYLKRATGPYTTGSAEATGFAKVDPTDPENVDLQVIPISSSIESIFLKKFYGLKKPIFTDFIKDSSKGKKTGGLLIYALHPKSVGYMTLRSKNPYDDPIFNPRYLSHPNDVQVLVNGIRFIGDMVRSPAFRRLGAKMKRKKFAACEHFPIHSDAYLTCYVRYMSFPTFHGTGTCKMGNPHDPNSVVDPLLRVKGIKGLRVVDASVIPSSISGNTNAPVIMLAERAADLIKYS